MELGDPISYLTLEAGTPVFSRDGERVGAVEHVLADANVDVFDGIVIDTRSGPGGWRFADAPEVESIHQHGVVLTLDAERGGAAAGAERERGDDGGHAGRRDAQRSRRQVATSLGLHLRPLLTARRLDVHDADRTRRRRGLNRCTKATVQAQSSSRPGTRARA